MIFLCSQSLDQDLLDAFYQALKKISNYNKLNWIMPKFIGYSYLKMKTIMSTKFQLVPPLISPNFGLVNRSRCKKHNLVAIFTTHKSVANIFCDECVQIDYFNAHASPSKPPQWSAVPPTLWESSMLNRMVSDAAVCVALFNLGGFLTVHTFLGAQFQKKSGKVHIFYGCNVWLCVARVFE